MKYALIIPDGCADEPQQELGGLTPLQAACTPHMDAVACAGVVGRADNVPASMPSGSDVATMSLFGYDPMRYHTGRAPLEAVAQGIALGPDDWAVRCNFVTIRDGIMSSFTAGQIPNESAARLIGRLKDECGSEEWEFHAGVSYRNLLIYRSQRGRPSPFDGATQTSPPHDLTDDPVSESLPTGPGSQSLLRFMNRSRQICSEDVQNQARAASGELPTTGIWLWGQGKRPALELFADRFGRTGAVITAVDLLRGIGSLLGWKVVDVPGATGYIDTDYAGKAAAAIRVLAEVDFVVVHVEASDEASHEGNAKLKVKSLEQIDEHIVGPLHAHLQSMGEHRILVSPDHPTFLRTKTHAHGFVPFALAGSDVEPDDNETYDELAASDSKLEFPAGWRLMERVLHGDFRSERATASPGATKMGR